MMPRLFSLLFGTLRPGAKAPIPPASRAACFAGEGSADIRVGPARQNMIKSSRGGGFVTEALCTRSTIRPDDVFIKARKLAA